MRRRAAIAIVAAVALAGIATPVDAQTTGSVRLMAVGDVMLGQSIGRRIVRYGPLAPWRRVVTYFNQADLVVANLECTISDRGSPWSPKNFTFRAPIAAANSLLSAGIDVVSQANNHAIDYGYNAFGDTLGLLDARGIGHVGGGSDYAAAHAPLIVERNGLRIAFLGYVLPIGGTPPRQFNTRLWTASESSPGVALGDPDMVGREVAAVRPLVDVVVVMVHGGLEYSRYPTTRVRKVTQAAADAGAQLVIAHHPHVLQGYRRSGGTLIAYSVGNFVFDYLHWPAQRHGDPRRDIDERGCRIGALDPDRDRARFPAPGYRSRDPACPREAPADLGAEAVGTLGAFDAGCINKRTPEVTDLAERPAVRSVPDIRVPLPGPLARKHVAFDHQFTSPSLPRAYPLVPVRGQGATIEDIDGNLLLDFTAGIAVSSTGYNHPRITAAIERQARQLVHFSASDFYLPVYAELAAKLDEISPIKGPTRSFIGNSGAEAIEAAIKLARFATGRQYLVAFLGGFHGRTYGAVTLTASKSKYHAGFGPMLPGVYHVPFGSAGLDELEQRVFKRLIPANEIAAIIVEPIQGEGGYVIPDDDFFPRLRQMCDEHGILLIADEVQSGAGRTGKMWAIEHWGVQPDIVASAKGIASGMPLGAMIARADLMSWSKGHHGSTFGGNAVSCAAALETIALLQEGLIDNARVRGEQALAGLRLLMERHPGLVTDVRGKGLMIGIEFDSGDTAEAVQWACFTRGLLVLEAGDNVVRLCPPLVVSADEVDTCVRILGDAVAAVAHDPKGAYNEARRWMQIDDGEVDG